MCPSLHSNRKQDGQRVWASQGPHQAGGLGGAGTCPQDVLPPPLCSAPRPACLFSGFLLSGDGRALEGLGCLERRGEWAPCLATWPPSVLTDWLIRRGWPKCLGVSRA